MDEHELKGPEMGRRAVHEIAIDVLERHAHGGTWWFDMDTGEIWWSPGMYKLRGVDPDDHPPSLETGLAFYEPESRERLQAALDDAVTTGAGWNFTVQIRRADGVLRHVQVIGQVERREGRLPLLAGAIFDVHPETVARNSRDKLRQELAERDMRWRIASENAGFGLLEIDLDNNRYHISGVFSDSLGLGTDGDSQMTREQWLAFVHPDDREQRQQQLDAHLAGETAVYVNEYRLLPDGDEEIWVQEAGRVLRDDGPARIVGTLADITARRVSERKLRESQRRLVQTLRHAPIGIALVAPDGRWLSVNQSLCEIVGYTEAELLALTFQDITHADDLDADLSQLDDLLAGRIRKYRMEKRYFHKQGPIVDVQLDVSLLRDATGAPLYFISHIQDITEQKQARNALFQASELAEITFESIGEGVIRIGGDGRITDMNSAARALLGVADKTLTGERFDDVARFYDANDDHQLTNPLGGVLQTGERVRVPIFTRLRRFDDRYISIVDSISAIHDADGGIRGAVFVFQDISEARQITDDLVHQANHDPLTGLPNRRGFEDALARTWRRVQAGQLDAFVMYLDLDHFKIVNDTCGHSAGDELLRQIALSFRSMLRESDILARLGGDEFAAIVHAKDTEGAQIVADKFIRAAGDLAFSFEGRSFTVGVSVGIAALESAQESTDPALIHADAALYMAKDSGRNRYYLYQDNGEDKTRAAAHVNTAELLQSGLSAGLFALYLQAIVNAQGERIGYEALLRLEGPDGVMRPGDFLPAARRLGLMSRIDRWVVAEALALVAAYRRRGLWPIDGYLSLNLSPVSLADPTFHAQLITMLDQNQTQADGFVFEITESEALFGEHYPQLLQSLHNRGFKVWLDDFAGGYNSFDMLKRASIDGIKIDRALLRSLEHDRVDRAVIRSIGDIADALSLKVAAEGVQTPAVFDLLAKAGVRHFQGDLFHCPEPAEAALVGAAGQLAAG